MKHVSVCCCCCRSHAQQSAANTSFSWKILGDHASTIHKDVVARSTHTHTHWSHVFLNDFAFNLWSLERLKYPQILASTVRHLIPSRYVVCMDRRKWNDKYWMAILLLSSSETINIWCKCARCLGCVVSFESTICSTIFFQSIFNLICHTKWPIIIVVNVPLTHIHTPVDWYVGAEEWKRKRRHTRQMLRESTKSTLSEPQNQK